jgi:hypothetical protein
VAAGLQYRATPTCGTTPGPRPPRPVWTV